MVCGYLRSTLGLGSGAALGLIKRPEVEGHVGATNHIYCAQARTQFGELPYVLSLRIPDLLTNEAFFLPSSLAFGENGSGLTGNPHYVGDSARSCALCLQTDAEAEWARTGLGRGRPLIPSPSPPGRPGEKGAGRIQYHRAELPM